LLTIKQLDVRYGDMPALRDVSLEVHVAEIVALVGANGAGKTTTLRTISGLLRARRGEIRFDGRRIDQAPPHAIVAAGLVHVPEGRKIFPAMTVIENLEVGATAPHARAQRNSSMDRVLTLFPRLAERRKQLAGSMSGGEQQMLAIGRALMACPRLLMLDEPSLGLAPLVVQMIFETIATINREQQIAILIVEQNVSHTLRMAHRGYVIEHGAIALADSGSALLANPLMRKTYLGL
jgi:branched-chain amino acid transport system ATP-binding protein